MKAEMWSQLTLALAGAVTVFAAVSDARAFRIPNWTCLLLVLLFPLFVWLSPAAVAWEKHLLISAIVFTFGYALYAKRLAGAGDVKLLAALSLWAGPSFEGTLLVVTALAGGILSLGIGALIFVRHRLSRSTEPLSLTRVPIPYGVAIALGGLSALLLLSRPDLSG